MFRLEIAFRNKAKRGVKRNSRLSKTFLRFDNVIREILLIYNINMKYYIYIYNIFYIYIILYYNIYIILYYIINNILYYLYYILRVYVRSAKLEGAEGIY